MEQTHDRSGQPDKHEIALRAALKYIVRSRHGLQNSKMKQLQSASVRGLVQKIENHPNRHGLQRDLQQSQSFNPFSQESKLGNIELCELLDTEPKTQCKVCLSYWDIGIVYCTCGHFLRKGTEENKKFVQYTMGLLCIPDYFFKERATNPSTVTGRNQGTENTTSPIHSRRSATRRMSWASTTDSYETKSSART